MSNFLKQAKRQSLLDAAYALFLEKGTFSTTIGDIVQNAGVAKGTFYLYFKDKNEIFHALVDSISTRVVADAVRVVDQSGETNFTERVILFADCIIEYFKKSPTVLRLLDKQFSWPWLEKELTSTSDPLMLELVRHLMDSPLTQTRTEKEIWELVFVMVEMVGATCYSSILFNIPAPIDEMKPVLYGIIRASLRQTPDFAADAESKA